MPAVPVSSRWASAVPVLVVLVRRVLLREVLAVSALAVLRVALVDVPVWVVPTLPVWPVVWVVPSRRC